MHAPGEGVHDTVTMCDVGEGVKGCVTSRTSHLRQNRFAWFCV